MAVHSMGERGGSIAEIGFGSKKRRGVHVESSKSQKAARVPEKEVSSLTQGVETVEGESLATEETSREELDDISVEFLGNRHQPKGSPRRNDVSDIGLEDQESVAGTKLKMSAATSEAAAAIQE
jgi:hypothetical protein